MTRMLIVAMISAIVSAPLALSIQYLIVNVLSKETIDEEKLAKEKEKLHEMRMKRIQSLRQREDCPDLDGSCGGSLDNDMKNLQGELMGHYKYLKGKSDGGVSAKEFRGNWVVLPFPVCLTPLLMCQIAGALLWARRATTNHSWR
jgi:hypothetical protein